MDSIEYTSEYGFVLKCEVDECIDPSQCKTYNILPNNIKEWVNNKNSSVTVLFTGLPFKCSVTIPESRLSELMTEEIKCVSLDTLEKTFSVVFKKTVTIINISIA